MKLILATSLLVTLLVQAAGAVQTLTQPNKESMQACVRDLQLQVGVAATDVVSCNIPLENNPESQSIGVMLVLIGLDTQEYRDFAEMDEASINAFVDSYSREGEEERIQLYASLSGGTYPLLQANLSFANNSISINIKKTEINNAGGANKAGHLSINDIRIVTDILNKMTGENK